MATGRSLFAISQRLLLLLLMACSESYHSRVTVLALCVSVSVCLSVTALAATAFVSVCNERHLAAALLSSWIFKS